MRERGSCCQSEKEPLEDEQQTARSSETSSWGFSCHQPSSPVWRWVLSPRGPSVVSSRRDIMEIVWSGPIEAINHSLQAFPLWTAQLAATYTLFITKTKFFCSSNTTSPGSTGLPLIYNNCVCDFNPIWVLIICKEQRETAFTHSAGAEVYRHPSGHAVPAFSFLKNCFDIF